MVGLLNIGTVSHGTLRPQDLLRRFSETYKQYFSDERDYNPFLEMSAELLADTLDDLEGDHVADKIYEHVDYTIDTLVEKLEALASRHNCYFGTHPGDGSDFGFWPNSEAEY